jgi:hypothetical protein
MTEPDLLKDFRGEAPPQREQPRAAARNRLLAAAGDAARVPGAARPRAGIRSSPGLGS